jgi:hypothetical protein
MRGSFKDVEDPNRLFEIKMNIKQSRYMTACTMMQINHIILQDQLKLN